MSKTVEQCVEELQVLADKLAREGAEDAAIIAALGEVAIAVAKRGPAADSQKAWLRFMLTAAAERNGSPVKCVCTERDTDRP